MTVATPKQPNLLEESGLPLAYPIEAPAVAGLGPPDREGYDAAVRSVVRSLTVMQKEAIVAQSRSGVAWRLASDEGPYLQGHDFAPAPLAFLTTGLAVDFTTGIERGFRAAGLDTAGLRTVIDTRFSIEGSLPRGTMVGGAEPPAITVHARIEDRSAATGAALTGVMTAPTAGLLNRALRGAFSLTTHGAVVPVGAVTQLDEPPPDASELPEPFPPPMRTSMAGALVGKAVDVGAHTPDAGVSLQKEQRRTLHLRAETSRRGDGLLATETTVLRPTGSTFRFVADEPVEGEPGVAAPDALTYLSAGIGFCFMTQLGRYAKILRRDLGDYQIVQDTRFSFGDPGGVPPAGGRAAAPRTHVYLAPRDDESFAVEALDIAEQTCFVHAMCRTELRPKVRVAAP